MSPRRLQPGDARQRRDIDTYLERIVPTEMMEDRFFPDYVDVEITDLAYSGVTGGMDETYHNGSYDVFGELLGRFARQHDFREFPPVSLVVKTDRVDDYVTLPMVYEDGWQVDVREDALMEGDFDVLGYSFADSLSALSHDSETHEALQELMPEIPKTFDVREDGLHNHLDEEMREWFAETITDTIERKKEGWYRQRGDMLWDRGIEPWDEDRYRRIEPDGVVDYALENAGIGFLVKRKIYERFGLQT